MELENVGLCRPVKALGYHSKRNGTTLEDFRQEVTYV